MGEKTKKNVSARCFFQDFSTCNFEIRIFLRMQSPMENRVVDMNPISHAIGTLNSRRLWVLISLDPSREALERQKNAQNRCFRK